MFLSPLKTLYSFKFYIESLKKSGWRAFFFLAYLFVLTALVLATATVYMAKPAAGNIVDKFAEYVPNIYVEDGIISANDNQPLTIAPPELQGYKIYFNTASQEPVYPTQMEQDKVLISINSNTLYFNYQGQFQETVMNPDADIEISRQSLLDNKEVITSFIAYTLASLVVFSQVLRLFFLVIFAFLIALIFNGYTRANMPGGKLLKLACYMQSPAALVYVLNFISPVKIPLMVLVYLVIFSVYSYMTLTKWASEPQQPEEEPVQDQEEEFEEEQQEEEGEDDTENKA